MIKRFAAFAAVLALSCPAWATVTTTASSASYTCNGTTVSYVVPWPYLAGSDLLVKAGTSTLVLGTDYTAAPPIAPTTGTVKLTTAGRCANGVTLTITRNMALTQPKSLRTGAYHGDVAEQVADRLAMQVQQNANTHTTDKATQATKDTSQDAAIVGVGNSVAALNGSSQAVTSASSVLAFGSTTARTLTARFADTVNVKDWNAKGDGATDDTTVIQAAINSLTAGVVLLPPATYVITTLTMKSGVWISLGGATLKMKANAAINAKMFDFSGVTNSGLLGSFTLDGNRANQTNVWNSGQFGVYIGPGATDIFIQSGYATGFSEDSLYIGSAGTAPNGIVVQRWVADQCYRNGVSITNAQNVYFGYLEGRSSNGNAPQAGLDIETNTAADTLTNIHIAHLNVHGNTGYGAQFLGVVSGTALVHGNVTVGRLDSYSNTQAGVLVYKMRRLSILNGSIFSNSVAGIEIQRDVQLLRVNAHVFSNGARGVNAAMTSQTIASSDWDFSDSVVRNNSQTTGNTQDGIRLDSDDVTKVLTRVRGDRVKLFDDQAVMTQRFGLSSGTNTSAVEFTGYVPANATGAYALNGPGYVETQRIFVSSVLTYTAIAAGASQVQSATVTGAAGGDQVIVSPTFLTDGLIYSGFVSAANTVKVTIGNLTAGSLTPGATTFKITVVKH